VSRRTWEVSVLIIDDLLTSVPDEITAMKTL